MKRNSTLWIVAGLMLIMLLTIAYLPLERAVINYIMIFAYILVLLSVNSSKSFIALLVMVLGYGFALTFYCYKAGFTGGIQAQFVVLHLFLTASLLLLWILFYHVKRLIKKVNTLEAQVQNLEKYEDVPNLLSENEFVSQAQLLITGTKRRNESSYLLKVQSTHQNETSKSTLYTATKICLEMLRNNYDLVTRYEDQMLLIFLQNTDESGAQVVINRMKEKLKIEFSTSAVSIQSTPIDTLESAFEDFNVRMNEA
ncbi:hypothetical protein [Priestia koreensis]|uniref:GGDEF domain-containing protein n=1 Tax=Priestia koreensis TaxID=284581 RepID=A0A0M0LH01_9BACI|nr:hypothetical protein [Priestia koreensis]KOO50365.1 hypothetical protein AMD01_01000 [Priestia koreensis]MCM3002932.1 hypothetical protein [Priestia koreensis]